MLKSLAKVFAAKVLQQELVAQSRLGHKLTLSSLPNDWINGFMVADMTKTWQADGLKCHGLNYFTMGQVKNGLSTRFQPDEAAYQGWLGGYLVEHDDPDWSTKEYISLSRHDQIKWLRHFGDKSPKMDFGEPKEEGQLYYWNGETHSDVGNRSSRLRTRGLMEGMAAVINKLNPELELQGNNFIPVLAKGQQSYGSVGLHGFHVIHKLGSNLSVVLYATATEKVDKSQLKSLLAHIRIDKL